MSRKILFSLLVIGAVIAAVGAITYAIFSDNVASDDQVFAAGTVDIKVGGADNFFDTTLDMSNMEAGDCKDQTVRVSNAGTLDVNLWNWIYTWKPSGDPRPSIFACDPNPKCNMYVKKTYVAGSEVDGEEFIKAGGWEDYKLEACLPLCAGNTCQNGYGKMRMFFHAVQASNLEGWDCVKLLYKEGPDWIPDPNIPKHGNKCYKADADKLMVVVNGYKLSANMPLQLALNGKGKCTETDQHLAGDLNHDNNSENFNAFYRGFWNEGGNLSQTCDAAKAGEGVYIFAHGANPTDPLYDAAAKTNGNGDFSGQWEVSLPDGDYQIKFLVKQDQSPWLEELDELDYQTFTIAP